MSDKKISQLTASTTPLTGTEVLPIVQSGATVKVSVDNLTTGKAVAVGSLTDAGNLAFTGTGNRITGDFSSAGASITSRILVQSSVVNGFTNLGTIPNGTNTTAGFTAFNNSDPTNSTIVSLNCTSTDARVVSSIIGTGTYLPMTFYTGGSKRVEVSTTGDVTVNTGNLVIGTAGKGIDFSADPSAAGMTSELLDDYEEGTWTPVITSTSGTITTVGTVVGRYTKVGRQVTVWFSAVITNNGTGAGAIRAASLPFVASSDLSYYGGVGANANTGKTIGASVSGNIFMSYADGTYPVGSGDTIYAAVSYNA